MKAQPNLVHELFAKHLTELGLWFERELPVCRKRKWRWDFVFRVISPLGSKPYAVEIDGFHKGRHGAGYGADYAKQNMGVILGWNPLRFTTREVNTGKAKEFIEQHILGRKGG